MTNKAVLSAAITGAILGIAGCATVPIPVYQLDRAEASIRGAEEVGALSVPIAKLHLQLAKDETEQAKKMAVAGDERAVLVMSRAEADAELALGLAREATVHGDALRAAEDLKALRSKAAP